MPLLRLLLIAVLFALASAATAPAQEPETERLANIERRVSELDVRVKDIGSAGMLAFLFGAFCALWAQNTGRSAWLWFFFGLAVGPIAVLFLLNKNSCDNFEKRQFGRTARRGPV